MRVTLGDVCEKGASSLKQSDVVNMTGEYPIYGAAGYIGNVDFYHQEKPYVAIVKDGAGIGRTTLYPAKSSVIGTMQYLLPKDNVLPEYLCYVVRHMHLEKYFTGATIPHIYFRDYKNEQFNLESLDKQAEIIEILGKAESIILKRRKELAELDNLIKARFVEMTESTDTVPTRMGDIATYINGYAFKPVQWEDSGYPIIRIQNLNDTKAPYNYYSGNLADKYLIHNGDVLVSWATHLEAYIWKGEEAWLNQHIFKVVFDKIEVDKTYFVFACEEALRQAFRNAHGFKPTMEHIKKADFDAAVVKLPNIQTQKEFAAFAAQVDKSKVVVPIHRMNVLFNITLNGGNRYDSRTTEF